MREQLSGLWENFLNLLDALPEDGLAISVYLIGSIILLWCWYSIVKRISAPVGGILWIVLFALVVTPTISEGPNSEIAPAVFGLLFGVLTKDSVLIWSNLSLISFVMGIGLLLGYCWTKFKAYKQAYKPKSPSTASPL
ncbi:hypothetical protein EC844_11755 [Acinetobacter calcoaceticus]|uniref:Uncharacterized protein n=1 Tax=Acinetobacter calcoaceticus TaxID=471 RepID=A0A4R1XLS8_ACICA|nr:hypothetical protein EC844_11755 [Acinetobacter calcoaceticus]